MKTEQCRIHPEAMMVSFCPKCLGSSRSEKKARASRLNGKRGGRPRLKEKKP